MKLFIFLSLFLSFNSWGQSEKLKNFFKDKTKIEDPISLRDPFKKPLLKNQKEEGVSSTSLMRDGVYTNIPEMGQLDVQTLKIVGVLIGKERRAMAKAGDTGGVVVLKEGMKIGADQAELKAILPGGVILVEKIVNVYGEEEYLETVIPISK